MAGANLATPLYAVYAQRIGFSSFVLTAIFTAYAFVLVPSLILFGRLSDRFGRRPVIAAGLGVSWVALLVFTFADSEAALFLARVLQGLAVGTISGAATAALVELDPDGDRRRAALFAGLAQAAGSAAGPLVSGVLAQWAPDPLRLPYVLWLAVTVTAGALVVREDAGRPEHPEPWRIQWPRVPREIAAPFARVSVTAACVWAVAALYLSIVPSYAAALLHTSNLALLAAVSALALVASAATQVIAGRYQTTQPGGQAAGLAILAAGLAGLVLASPLHSLPVLVVSAVLAGAGHALGFLNAQQELNEIAPPERRGEVTAAFIACIYLLVAVSVISTGALDAVMSLTGAFVLVASVLAALAVAMALWQLRVRRVSGCASRGTSWRATAAASRQSRRSPRRPGESPSR
jgi:MFS family permease